ncbi:MAG TPA: tRNA 2-thiouridine(34) synthase MnmA [Solirubrobacteraceae bacterium]|nr:tRNA 2-thiouridine(34) synthase MnmA [Solirubrobacteraceae bacterium]
MDLERFAHHLESPQGYRHVPADASTGAAGGGGCCDRLQISLAVHGDRVVDAGFDGEGCGAALAAGSAVTTLVRGRPILEVARVGPREIAAELGGLSPGKLHAADLGADALHRALGTAVRERARIAPPESGSPRTLVAMSGGVDSAVAALLSAREGETVAVTLELWADVENDEEMSCCSASAVRGARSIAHRMGMPHFTLDLRKEFRAGVVEPFISGHAAGETPNPCVRCNGNVRLDAMLAFADVLACGQLATGHYARVADRGNASGPLLRAAADPAKDQTYMLAALAPDSLARMTFPLGDLTKPEVRAMAAEAGLPVAGKPDSQDLCFLAGTDRSRFLARHGGVEERPGEVVDSRGTPLGRHRGHHGFTIGQRRGLRLGGGEPLYVLDKDAESNRVVVGPRADLLTDRVAVRAARLHRSGARVDRIKLRYRSQPLPARLAGTPSAGRHSALTVHLDAAADAAAPGQLACLMDGELVVGWGTIARAAT